MPPSLCSCPRELLWRGLPWFVKRITFMVKRKSVSLLFCHTTYTYVYTSIYIHTHNALRTYIHTHTYIHIYIHAHGIHTYIYACIHTYIRTYITFYYISLHYITFYYIALHYITLHCITLHYITLHYTRVWMYFDFTNENFGMSCVVSATWTCLYILCEQRYWAEL
jgi:hypothetical protein